MRAETDGTEILALHRKVVEEEVNSSDKCNVTGLLISQGNSVLHFLEGPSASIQRILLALASSDHFEKIDTRSHFPGATNSSSSNSSSSSSAMLQPIVKQTGRVIYCVEDRPQRLYPEWYSCTFPERKTGTDDITAENCKDIVFEISTKLMEVGKRLKAEQQNDDPEISKYVCLLILIFIYIYIVVGIITII